MITIQKYVRPQSLEEAYQLNQAKNSRIIGGMLWLKTGSGNVGTAIDLSALGLNTIEETDDEFIIGAYVTLRQLEKHESLNAYTCGAVKCAVQDIVGVQFRNMATIGGSIWGRFGFSDVLTVLLSMDTFVETYKGGLIALNDFAKLPYPYDNDILTHIIIKKTSASFAYSAMRAQRTDLPVLTCAVSKVGEEYRLAVGARPGRAVLITDTDAILANGISEESAAEFAEFAAATILTDSNVRGSAEYRTHLIKVLTQRNLMKLGGCI